MQSVAKCTTMYHCVALCCTVLHISMHVTSASACLVAVCCSVSNDVLQCCCTFLQYAALKLRISMHVTSAPACFVAVCCSGLLQWVQCVDAVGCSWLQCVAVYSTVLHISMHVTWAPACIAVVGAMSWCSVMQCLVAL